VDNHNDNVGRGLEDNTFSPLTLPQIIFHGTNIYVDNFIGPC